MLLRRDTIRAIPSGWVVAGPTGSSVVCRTYDELVEAVSRRSQTAVDDIRHLGLGDPAQTA
ncbi:hypothetical protein GS4_07_00810 [Gordonia soli NBRC 108243]|uniref:Uncharacterized protein n=2 Tax=Gordonia soli TaxID=320799 RepID=M0QIS6_9ACTN|nr:hypothetical protein GS4_07_00810 [Gordonia soli NBRC 108243]